MQKFKTVDELISQLKPEQPIYCIRKNSILIIYFTLIKLRLNSPAI